MFNYLKNTFLWLLRFIELQLFLTLITWPIIIAWGIPLSLASPLGNLLGNPLLSIFLCISSFIFITEIVHIPNSFLIAALERATHAWLSINQSITFSSLYAAPKPNMMLLLLIPLGAVFIMLHKKIVCIQMRILALLTFFAITACVLNFMHSSHLTTTLMYKKAHIPFIIHNRQSYLIFDKPLRTHRPTQQALTSWANYTLRPMLAQTAGVTKLDAVCILQPSTCALLITAQLCSKNLINKVYLYSTIFEKYPDLIFDLTHITQQFNIQIICLDKIYKNFQIFNAIYI